MSSTVETLADAYPKQQARCRKLLEHYAEVAKMPGVNVTFAVAMINDVLRRAEIAAASGDVVAMLGMFKEMEGCE